MCIAIFNPSDAPDLTRETVNVCRANNPDGMGLMYAHDGRIHIVRQLRRRSRFYRRYMQARALGVDVVLHFRIATHGWVDLSNTHPVQVNERLAFVHNGILSQFTPTLRDDISDSRLFAYKCISQLPDNWLKQVRVRKAIERMTLGSRLVFLDNRGRSTILHERGGEWKEGSWFSNGSHDPNYWDTQYDYADNWQPLKGATEIHVNYDYVRGQAIIDGTYCDICGYSHEGMDCNHKAREYSSFEEAWNDHYREYRRLRGGAVEVKRLVSGPSGPSVRQVENPTALDGISLTSIGVLCHGCARAAGVLDECTPLWDDGEPISCEYCAEWFNL
jgi:hypothetical protein